MTVRALFARLVAAPPDSEEAQQAAWDLEPALMDELRAHGVDGIRRIVEDAGLPAVEPSRIGPIHVWRAAYPDGRVLEVSARNADELLSVSVHWVPPPPPLSPREKARQARQERFYGLYLDAANREREGARLAPHEKTAVLVGEMEADVNNGGFSQYLLNKGRPRARQALAALESVGSKQVAAMLREAMTRGADLEELDARFYACREDLPSLVMKSAPPAAKRPAPTKR